ncbi:MAG: carbamate kinase [Myxococcota bacterium]
MSNSDVTIVAMGGNSLIDPQMSPTVENQFHLAAIAVKPIADLIESGERIVITHGNGPQVGFMALRSELSKEQIHEVPLDSIVANTQGSLGYMIQRALGEEFRRRKFKHEVVSIVTEVEVNPDDDAFGHPTKPIGRFYTEEEADVLAMDRGWDMVLVQHRGWRRVVPSPAPVKIVQLPTIQRLLDQGVTVVCCGGGGIPVVRDQDGSIRGMEAVIDKDRVSALLAVRMGVKRLFLTTGTDAIYRNFARDNEEKLSCMSIDEVREMADGGQFPPGSMGPKVEAAVRFIVHGGEEAVVCQPTDLVAAFSGNAGTRIISKH